MTPSAASLAMASSYVDLRETLALVQKSLVRIPAHSGSLQHYYAGVSQQGPAASLTDPLRPR